MRGAPSRRTALRFVGRLLPLPPLLFLLLLLLLCPFLASPTLATFKPPRLTRKERAALTKVLVAIRDEFEGDAHSAFRRFDVDPNDEALSPAELEAGLLHFGVGNEWTMDKWISRVLAQLDRDGDRQVSLDELHRRVNFKLSFEAAPECNDPNCVARRGKKLQIEKDWEAGEEL